MKTKTLFTIILWLVSFNLSAQSYNYTFPVSADSLSILTGVSRIAWLYGDYYGSNPNYVSFSAEDSSVEISGDTIELIKALVYEIRKLNNENADLCKVIYRGVDFANQVPDFYRTARGNCKWDMYFRELKKQGYIEVKSKKSRKPCK